jgi:hypothetical protein
VVQATVLIALDSFRPAQDPSPRMRGEFLSAGSSCAPEAKALAFRLSESSERDGATAHP